MKLQAKEELKKALAIKKSERPWHIALLASLCVGSPLILGWYFNQFTFGFLAAISGTVILYLPLNASTTIRMVTLLTCSFGYIISFTVGLLFSFNPLISSLTFGLFAIAIHWITLNYKLKPPGNFFFLFIASLASFQVFSIEDIPQKIGTLALGTIFSCLLALTYCFLAPNPFWMNKKAILKAIRKNKRIQLLEALILGIFMFATTYLGHILAFKNPYWIPISCAAVMQGATLNHIWQRSFQRILGTFTGLILSWFLLSYLDNLLSICLAIIILQFCIELVIIKQYALAVFFITPMTLLMAEAANPNLLPTDQLIQTRALEITIGSILGAIGDWFIHQEKLKYQAAKGIQKVSISLKKKLK